MEKKLVHLSGENLTQQVRWDVEDIWAEKGFEVIWTTKAVA